MTHEEAFLEEILAQRDEDAPRLIYADWLLDQPCPVRVARGEFIHLQCQAVRALRAGTRPRMQLQRERSLLEQHGREWGRPFQRLGCQCWEYRRGFVEGVGLPLSAFLEHGAALVRATPLRELKLSESRWRIGALAESPHLRHIEILDVENNQLAEHDFEVLVASRHLTHLRTLLAWSNQIGDAGVAALARTDWERLARVDLSYNGIGDEGIMALAASPMIGRLSILDLTGNRITDTGALALVASAHADGLGWLDLTKNPLSQSAQNLLRERFAGRIQVLA